MADKHQNMGYERFGVWHEDEFIPAEYWGEYMKAEYKFTIEITISPDLRTLTATITDWNYNPLDPGLQGSGFIDYLGFAWYDKKHRPEFEDQWFLNYDHPVPPYYDVHLGGPGENWEIVEDELGQISDRTQSGFWDVLTFFYVWQRNDSGGNQNQYKFPDRQSHTWELTDDDWDENGKLVNRILFYVYDRHRDNGGDLYLGPPHKEEHAHWEITERYWLDFEKFNWKYHPLAIRKGGEWYSCNRLDSEVGHGDGHTAIRKGGRWNGVWNDDFLGNLDSEGYYDDVPEGKGDYTFLPRVGVGKNADRSVEKVHEWES